MRTTALIQARMGSTRLPGKITKPILGEPMLARMLERVKRATSINSVVVATTDRPEDDATVHIAEDTGVSAFRGSERDVLDRFYKAAKEAGAEVVVRLTGDCPLMDPAVINQVVEHFERAKGTIDYCSTPSNYPEGLDTEIFTFRALEEAAHEAKLPSEREHVTLYIKNHPERFVCESWREGESDNSNMHWSVDTQADFDFVTKIFEKLYLQNPSFTKDDILRLLTREPQLLEINRGGTGYEGLAKSLEEDKNVIPHHD